MEAKKAEAQKDAAWADEQLETLTEEQKDHCLRVKFEGLGVCSRCRYSSGCDRCSYPHAVKYWLRRPQQKMTQQQKNVVTYGL